MKKIFALCLVVIIISSFALPVFAFDKAGPDITAREQLKRSKMAPFITLRNSMEDASNRIFLSVLSSVSLFPLFIMLYSIFLLKRKEYIEGK